MISPWYFFSCFPNCIVCLYPILSILKRFYTRTTDICEIPHRSNTNFNPKEISVLVGNLQETKLQIWRNLLAQKPRETERTHLRHVTILHVWYFLDNITSDKKKGGKKMIVLDVSRLHKKFRKKKKGNWQEDNEEKAYQCDDHAFCLPFFFITIRFVTSTDFFVIWEKV